MGSKSWTMLILPLEKVILLSLLEIIYRKSTHFNVRDPHVDKWSDFIMGEMLRSPMLKRAKYLSVFQRSIEDSSSYEVAENLQIPW